jgi:hypothetical protein
MPVLDARSTLDDIAGAHDLLRFVSFLVVAGAMRDDKNLAGRILVPIQFLSWRESCGGHIERKDAIGLAEFDKSGSPLLYDQGR